MCSLPTWLLITFNLVWSCKSARKASPPHIIMIVADDLGFNDVSFHGSSQIPTPNIDQLANNGIVLNNYYVLPSCTPSRSALLTGRYPIHTGMQSGTIYAANPWGLGLDEKILPQYLKPLGYKTHAVGKWHLGFFSRKYTPTQRGFDSFYGFYGGQADYWDHSLASNGYWGLDLHHDTVNTSKNIWTQWGNYSTKMYSMEAVDRIRRHDNTSPLFLYLSYQAVHSANMIEDPLQAPQKWIDRFKHIKHRGRRKYAAMVAYMDFGIGKVIAALKEKNMFDNSIIIFTTDNGGPANGFNMNWATNYPLRGVKTTVYEGGVRAAGCLYSKLLKYPKTVSFDLMHVTDWLPTLVNVAGGDVPTWTNLDGKNLWSTFQHETPSPRDEILINIDPHVYHNSALRKGDWKLVNQSRFWDGWYAPPGLTSNEKSSNSLLSRWFSYKSYAPAEIVCKGQPRQLPKMPCGGKKGRPCLFNIRTDPCEYKDVSREHPDIYEKLLQRLREYRESMVPSRRNTHRASQANPKLHGGVWVPWKQKTKKVIRQPKSTFLDFLMEFIPNYISSRF